VLKKGPSGDIILDSYETTENREDTARKLNDFIRIRKLNITDEKK